MFARIYVLFYSVQQIITGDIDMKFRKKAGSDESLDLMILANETNTDCQCTNYGCTYVNNASGCGCR